MSLEFNKLVDLPPERLMTLTDGIFAIAITLLVLGIELHPTTHFSKYIVLYHFLVSVTPQLITYAISFIILSSFWIYHHVFLRVKKITVPFLWLSVLWLLVSVLMPFTTSLMGEYSQFYEADLIFGINVSL